MTADDFNQSLLEENANSRATDLTKREYFAGVILAGLLSYHGNPGPSAVKRSTDIADALLKELSE